MFFFETTDSITPQDTNGATDVYEWEADGEGTCTRGGGCVQLISRGRRRAARWNHPVCLFVSTASAAERCAESDDQGGYVFQGLTSGSYQVGFSLGAAEIAGTGSSAEVGGYIPQFYDGAATRARATTIFLPTAATAEGVAAAVVPAAVPAALIVAPQISTLIVPASPTGTAPEPKKTACRRGYRMKTVRGRTRCVGSVKKKRKGQRRDGGKNR